MNIRVADFALVAIVLATTASGRQGAQKDQQAVQGNWSVIKYVSAGKAQPDDMAKKITLTVSGDKFTMKLDADVIKDGTFKLDAAKKPKHLDVTHLSGPNKGQVRLGIYELEGEGETLKTCFLLDDDGGKKRPGGFEPERGVLVDMMVLRRAKK